MARTHFDRTADQVSSASGHSRRVARAALTSFTCAVGALTVLAGLLLAPGCSDDPGPIGSGGATTTDTSGGGAAGGAGGGAMVCTPGATRSCYSGPPGTEGVGACKAGVQTCPPDGLEYGPCEGSVTPHARNCATPDVDEACNGTPGPCDDPPLFGAIYGTADKEVGFAVAGGPAGEMFLLGSHEGGIDFGAGPLAPAGTFLVALDPAGAVLWQKTWDSIYARSLVADTQGNLFLFGAFSGSLDFGGGPLAVGPDGALFLAKLGPSGEHIFSKSFVVDFKQSLEWPVALAPTGEIVIAGTLAGAADFGGGPLDGPGDDVFVVKLDATGQHLWSKRFGDPDEQVPNAVAVDAQGAVLVAGYFSGTVDFGGGSLVASDYDAFVVKLDAGGAHVWSKSFGDAEGDELTGLAVDADGDVVFAGATGDTAIDLGGGPVQADPANLLCFAGALSTDGDPLWSKAFGCHMSPYVPYGPRVAALPSGRVVVSTSFDGVSDFGQGPMVDDSGDAALFAVEADGATAWVYSVSSAKYDQGLDVAVDGEGNVLFAGHVEDDADLGAGLLPAHGVFDAFLVKLAP